MSFFFALALLCVGRVVPMRRPMNLIDEPGASIEYWSDEIAKWR